MEPIKYPSSLSLAPVDLYAFDTNPQAVEGPVMDITVPSPDKGGGINVEKVG